MEQIPEIIHESWHEYMQDLFDDRKMRILKEEILPREKFYPPAKDIFKVFSMPLNSIKVLILGQDPYPKGEATGLAFAVHERIPMPGSLKVIANEISKEGLKSGLYDSDIPHWKTLEAWAEQGVFLLNTALTVKAGEPGSHTGYWNWFTKEIIRVISIKQPSVWLLWGSKAQGFKDYIRNYHYWKDTEDNSMDIPLANWVLEAPHPAAELYNGNNGVRKTFTGCNHFKICNQILKFKKQTLINW